MTDLLKNPIFSDETKAREWLEARVWPEGPVCPHCGNADQDRITGLQGKAHRPGVYQCNEQECREKDLMIALDPFFKGGFHGLRHFKVLQPKEDLRGDPQHKFAHGTGQVRHFLRTLLDRVVGFGFNFLGGLLAALAGQKQSSPDQ